MKQLVTQCYNIMLLCVALAKHFNIILIVLTNCGTLTSVPSLSGDQARAGERAFVSACEQSSLVQRSSSCYPRGRQSRFHDAARVLNLNKNSFKLFVQALTVLLSGRLGFLSF